MKLPFSMPFTRSTLVDVTPTGGFFTAWTENFLIKKYDQNGKYIRAFYYPVKKSKLSLNALHINKIRRKVLRNYKMPKTWPALDAMELDSKGRLWVATITGSKTSFRWWVLSRQGKPVARFTFPGKRKARRVMPKPIVEIKKGYFYTHRYDIRKGIDQIVKYKINFEAN